MEIVKHVTPNMYHTVDLILARFASSLARLAAILM
jgi:hypothetical protein